MQITRLDIQIADWNSRIVVTILNPLNQLDEIRMALVDRQTLKASV